MGDSHIVVIKLFQRLLKFIIGLFSDWSIASLNISRQHFIWLIFTHKSNVFIIFSINKFDFRNTILWNLGRLIKKWYLVWRTLKRPRLSSIFHMNCPQSLLNTIKTLDLFLDTITSIISYIFIWNCLCISLGLFWILTRSEFM